MQTDKMEEPNRHYIHKSESHLQATSVNLDERFETNPVSFQERFMPNDVYFINLGRGRLIGQEFFCQSKDYVTTNKALTYLTTYKAIDKKQIDNVVIKGEEDCKYISCANAGYKNFYHWMFQALPTILQALRMFKNEKFKIVVPPLQGFRLKTIELLGLSNDNILELKDNESLDCNKLYFCNLTSGDFSYLPSPYLNILFDEFYSKAVKNIKQDSYFPKRVFISRKDSPKRAITNESEVSALLNLYGFTEVVMSELSLEEQLFLFKHAEYIVAPHGAGLVNLVFGNPNLNVLELIPNNYINDCFYRICVLRGHSYLNLYAESENDKHYHYSNSSVNLKLLEEKMEVMNLKKEKI